MNPSHWLSSIAHRVAGLPLHTRLVLGLATVIVMTELMLRQLAPRSRFYAKWTAFFQAIGHAWTVVLLSVVYAVAVGPMRLAMRLAGKDLLDRSLGSATTAWRPHVPNPLGPEAAARHQF